MAAPDYPSNRTTTTSPAVGPVTALRWAHGAAMVGLTMCRDSAAHARLGAWAHETGREVETTERLKLLQRNRFGTLKGDLVARGDLHLKNYQHLSELPPLARVQGCLKIEACPRLKVLPSRLQVRDFVSLKDCEGLLSLPEGFSAGGSLIMRNCPQVTELPRHLTVGGDLNLRGCENLSRLPDDLSVGMDLNIEGCRSLESLPSSFLSWSRDRYGIRHGILLSGSGLSQETLERLRSFRAPNLYFSVSHSFSPNGNRFSSLVAAVDFWSKESGVPFSWKVSLPEVSQITVIEFLSRLRESKEFGIQDTRQALAQRTICAIELLADLDVQSEVIQRMEDSIDACHDKPCHDKPVWALNQLVLVGLISKAQDDSAALQELGRRVMRLMIVQEHAERKVKSLEWVDDVCVYLRFEIQLREALDLPVQATSMLFPSYIKVTEEELEAAKKEALSVTEEAFHNWLATWSPWERHLRDNVAAALEWSQQGPTALDPTMQFPDSDLSGDPVHDPVLLRGQIWSMHDLLRHWRSTGLDLTNAPLNTEELRSIQRVVDPMHASSAA